MTTPRDLDLFKLGDPCRAFVNIAELYYRAWDPITELVQNSLQAILDRQAREPDHIGKITVNIDARSSEIVVSDNGVGFPNLQVLAPNRTTRDVYGKTPQSGFGIGATSVLARSDLFKVSSKNIAGKHHQARWSSVYSKLRAQKVAALQPDSASTSASAKSAAFTTITAQGKEGFADLWTAVNEDPLRVLEILRAHTALGHTSAIWGGSVPRCRYAVSVTGTSSKESATGQIGFPAVEIGTAGTFDFERYRKNSNDLPSPDELIVLVRKGRKSRLRKHKYNAYIACEVDRATGLIEKRFGKYIHSLENNRILVSVNGFLQSFHLERPSERQTRSLWGNIFAIVDCDANIVEPGRNRIADIHIRDINELLRQCITELDNCARAVRDQDKYGSTIDVDQAKIDVEKAAAREPLLAPASLNLKFSKAPEREQEVVALFFELVGKNFIPNIEVLRVGANEAVYDAYFKHSFTYAEIGRKRRPTREEGKRRVDLAKNRVEVMTCEFKQTAADLVIELETGRTKKRLDGIDILVCWEEGSLQSAYVMQPLQDDERKFSAATHRLSKKGAKWPEGGCEVLVLSEKLDALDSSDDT